MIEGERAMRSRPQAEEWGHYVDCFFDKAGPFLDPDPVLRQKSKQTYKCFAEHWWQGGGMRSEGSVRRWVLYVKTRVDERKKKESRRADGKKTEA